MKQSTNNPWHPTGISLQSLIIRRGGRALGYTIAFGLRNIPMNSRIIQIFSMLFLLLALPYPIMRINGFRDADLPAFGAVIMAMIMVIMLNSRIIVLEKNLNELRDSLKSNRKNSQD
ncbi:MAG: hypothetical protein RLZZ214_1242 [Verrucomicrobiota bacterium]|jgi:hypothetical protein